MTSLSSLVGPYPTGIVRLVLGEMFPAVIRSIRVTAAVGVELVVIYTPPLECLHSIKNLKSVT